MTLAKKEPIAEIVIGLDDDGFKEELNTLTAIRDGVEGETDDILNALLGEMAGAEDEAGLLAHEITREISHQVNVAEEDVKRATTNAMNEMYKVDRDLADLKLRSKVSISTIVENARMAKSIVFDTLTATGVVIDESLRAVIDTGFATAQYLLSAKAAAMVEGPTGWVRIGLLSISYAMTLAATIRSQQDRARIRTTLNQNTKQFTRTRSINKL